LTWVVFKKLAVNLGAEVFLEMMKPLVRQADQGKMIEGIISVSQNS
jgi:hypothetical protein